MPYDFFAMMSRMKYIERWALMRNSITENISEHSLEVAMIAHGLAVIGKLRCGKDVNPDRAALLGIYHDCTEIITGDMPTPIKYYNQDLKEAYKEVENVAAERLLRMLPNDFSEYYKGLLIKDNSPDETCLWQYVKAADKISALIKCMEEEKTGNREFVKARETTEKSIKEMDMEEIGIFMEEFLPGYEKTLDELGIS